MLDDHDPPSHKAFRNPLLYTSILIGIVLLYLGWTFLSRWQSDKQLEQQNKQQQAEKRRAEDERSIETLGGDRFEILNFYISPGEIRRGETAELCYGVSNAKSVQLEPSTESMWPSLNRCFEIAPKKDTTYTLTAQNAAGTVKTASVTLKVR